MNKLFTLLTVLALAFVLVGCESAQHRCARIDSEDATYHLYTSSVALAATLQESLAQDSVERARYTNRGTTLIDPAMDSRDSSTREILQRNDTTPHAPPRPSDAAWYGEHCFNGIPR